VIDDNGLMQIVEVPTRKNIILDLIITNWPNQINRTHTLPGIADHDIVYTELDIKSVRRKHTPRQILQYNKADSQGFRQLILQTATKIAEFESHASTEELWKLLSDDLHRDIETFIPTNPPRQESHCHGSARNWRRKLHVETEHTPEPSREANLRTNTDS